MALTDIPLMQSKKEQAKKACKELNARLDRLTGRKTAS